MLHLGSFTTIWLVNVASITRTGECPEPIALAAMSAHTDDLVALNAPYLRTIGRSPYPTGPDTLIITADGQSLVGLHLALGWKIPERLIDLLLEHRVAINGRGEAHVGGLVGALLFYGRPASEALGTGIGNRHLRRRLAAVSTLFEAMRSKLDVGRALLRGRYLCACSRIEATGIPMDRDTLAAIRRDWPGFRSLIIREVDRGSRIYQGDRFEEEAFAAWLGRQGIRWPLTTSRRLDLGDETWREMARLHPIVRPLRELRSTLLTFDPLALAVGSDSRNRTPLRPFSTV
ncbi:MAG: hypothetical protein JSS20_21795, partial [Proteobacteria bacterium]|nr:hypothetical protein [Pseudomonadota bacterium]